VATERETMNKMFRALKVGQKLRQGDLWRNGSGRWVEVKWYNFGQPIPKGPNSHFRRKEKGKP
jgi:hypothetical protein